MFRMKLGQNLFMDPVQYFHPLSSKLHKKKMKISFGHWEYPNDNINAHECVLSNCNFINSSIKDWVDDIGNSRKVKKPISKAFQKMFKPWDISIVDHRKKM
eukprot:UN24123